MFALLLLTMADPQEFKVHNLCPPVFTVTNAIPPKPKAAPVAQPVTPVAIASGPSWTWPGGTVESLRSHLAAEHGYSAVYLAGMNFAELKAVHDRDHNRKTVPVVIAAPSSNCPGGVCPAPQHESRGFFRRLGFIR